VGGGGEVGGLRGGAGKKREATAEGKLSEKGRGRAILLAIAVPQGKKKERFLHDPAYSRPSKKRGGKKGTQFPILPLF